jgi:hypothetical protein
VAIRGPLVQEESVRNLTKNLTVPLDGDANAWPNGAIIELDGESHLRVVGYLESDNPEPFGVLVVERVWGPLRVDVAITRRNANGPPEGDPLSHEAHAARDAGKLEP